MNPIKMYALEVTDAGKIAGPGDWPRYFSLSEISENYEFLTALWLISVLKGRGIPAPAGLLAAVGTTDAGRKLK